jgi:SAM-dependent methyltransferase
MLQTGETTMKFGEEYFDFCKNTNNFDMNVIGEWQNNYFKMLCDIFEEHISKKHKMFDMGCATGVLLETFRRNGLENMWGGDVSDWYVQNTPFPEIKSRMSNIEGGKLPFSNDSFYFIHMAQVIEHIPEEHMLDVLKELYRVLMPGGVLYIATVGPLLPGTTDVDPTHVSLFTREKWEQFFLTANFRNAFGFYKDRFENNKMAKEYNWVNFVLTK